MQATPHLAAVPDSPRIGHWGAALVSVAGQPQPLTHTQRAVPTSTSRKAAQPPASHLHGVRGASCPRQRGGRQRRYSKNRKLQKI